MGKWPKLSEEAVSMVLGLVVVLLIFSLIFRYFNRKKGNIEVPGITNMITLAPTGGLERREYQVQKGDSLWKIALKTYGSGYNWVDIQKENKLDNPGMLMVGQKLNLPQTPKREVIFEEYTVIK